MFHRMFRRLNAWQHPNINDYLSDILDSLQNIETLLTEIRDGE